MGGPMSPGILCGVHLKFASCSVWTHHTIHTLTAELPNSKVNIALWGAGRQYQCNIYAFYTGEYYKYCTVSFSSFFPWRFMSFCSPRPRWVVPVLPKGELEVLLEAAIDLSKKGGSAQNVLFHRGALWHWHPAVCAYGFHWLVFCQYNIMWNI